jgi:hypothetical protein
LPQLPLTHDSPAGHVFPHPPQFLASDEKSTQSVPQVPFGATHAAAQTPAEQVVPAAQTFPQAPQFLSSLPVATHAPEQAVVPGPQMF